MQVPLLIVSDPACWFHQQMPLYASACDVIGVALVMCYHTAAVPFCTAVQVNGNAAHVLVLQVHAFAILWSQAALLQQEWHTFGTDCFQHLRTDKSIQQCHDQVQQFVCRLSWTLTPHIWTMVQGWFGPPHTLFQLAHSANSVLPAFVETLIEERPHMLPQVIIVDRIERTRLVELCWSLMTKHLKHETQKNAARVR
jgi:hypothetical protein